VWLESMCRETYTFYVATPHPPKFFRTMLLSND
jgi:hypothetical protein